MKEGRFVTPSDPLYAQAVERLCRSRPPALRRHICIDGSCEPRNEAQLIAAGALRGPPLTCNVFVCRYGGQHCCGPDTCSMYLDNEQTCPVSGMQWGQQLSEYRNDDPRTWRGAAPLPEPEAPLPDDELEARGGRVVRQLLFSAVRASHNRAMLAALRHQADVKRSIYCEQRRAANQLPILTDLCRITAHVMSTARILTLFEHDEALQNYYTAVVLQTWRRVQRHHQLPASAFEAVCLGTLYGMRAGERARGTVLLPADDFLRQHLPMLHDLERFGYDKGDVTAGVNLISAAFQDALGAGATPSSLALDVTQLPQRQADRPATINGRPVKYTASGEVLFVLQKRPK